MLEYIIYLKQHKYFFSYVCLIFPLYNFEGDVIIIKIFKIMSKSSLFSVYLLQDFISFDFT